MVPDGERGHRHEYSDSLLWLLRCAMERNGNRRVAMSDPPTTCYGHGERRKESTCLTYLLMPVCSLGA